MFEEFSVNLELEGKEFQNALSAFRNEFNCTISGFLGGPYLVQNFLAAGNGPLLHSHASTSDQASGRPRFDREQLHPVKFIEFNERIERITWTYLFI